MQGLYQCEGCLNGVHSNQEGSWHTCLSMPFLYLQSCLPLAHVLHDGQPMTVSEAYTMSGHSAADSMTVYDTWCAGLAKHKMSYAPCCMCLSVLPK